jgi:O-antigen chain-terminating methyltransferase
MDEREILVNLRAYVARHQSSGPDDQTPPRRRTEVSAIDLSNISRFSAEVWAWREEIGKLNPRNPGLLNDLVQVFKRAMQRSLSWYTRSLQTFSLNVARAIEEQGVAINGIERSLARLEDELLKIQSDIPAMVQSNRACENEVLQEALRVAELAVQEQQTPYAELFRGLSPVVDVGCGRGEFLELLRDGGIAAYGVDSDRGACEVARRKLLKVVEGDFFEHLQHLPDRSLGGVFSARAIEYLPTHRQVELVALLSRKTKPRGLAVIETLNPESTVGFGRNSRLDPSHLHPIHSDVLKGILESNYFEDVKICALAPVERLLAPATDLGNFRKTGSSLLPGANGRVPTQSYAAVARRR